MEVTIFPEAAAVDYDLEAQVREAIWGVDELRSTNAEISVRSHQGHIELTGIVPSAMAGTEVERATWAVPGVISVVNRLTDDGTLARNVAAALAEHPTTKAIPPGYQVMSHAGQVTLIGRFTAAQTEVLATVARTEPNVQSVQVKNL